MRFLTPGRTTSGISEAVRKLPRSGKDAATERILQELDAAATPEEAQAHAKERT